MVKVLLLRYIVLVWGSFNFNLKRTEGFSLGFESYRPSLGQKNSGTNIFEESVQEQDGFRGCFTRFEGATDHTFVEDLGTPKGQKFLCIHRFKLWWMKPLHVPNAAEIPLQTLMLVSKGTDTQGKPIYTAFLPLVDQTATCTLQGNSDGQVQLFAESGDPATKLPSAFLGLFVGEGNDPFVTIQKSMEAVQTRYSKSTGSHNFPDMADLGLAFKMETSYNERSFIDKLGWCTWDSFYTMVSHENILEGLESLKKDGLKFGWMIIDDGWQSTNNPFAKNSEQWDDQLTSFRENQRFAEGGSLKSAIDSTKSKFGIDQVLVWQTIAGYWAGVQPESSEMRPYNPKPFKLHAPDQIYKVDQAMKEEFDTKDFGMISPESAHGFFQDYHRYLKDQGVDGVKVDAQALLNAQGRGNGGTVAATRAFSKALYDSVSEFFLPKDLENALPNLIHCMCHTPEIFQSISKLYSRARPLMRGGDDFYPNDVASHGPHLYAQAYNALLINWVGLQDWDMFQTSLGHLSNLHAAARAVSGGPVYISDRPGNHDLTILRKLVLDDGTVLRPLHSAMPTVDMLFDAPTRTSENSVQGLLKVWNTNPTSGILGIFNIAGAEWNQTLREYSTTESVSMGPRYGTISPSDVNSIKDVPGSEFAVYLHKKRSLHKVHWEDKLPIEVESLGYEIATVSKVYSVAGTEGCGFASIGLVNMFNSGGAVIRQVFDTGSVLTEVQGCGVFEAFCSQKPKKVSILAPHTDTSVIDEQNIPDDKEVNFEFETKTEVGKLKIHIPKDIQTMFLPEANNQMNTEMCNSNTNNVLLRIEW